MWVPDDRHLYKLLTDWGGFIGGIFALAAAGWAVTATRSTAKDQIDAARKQADKQINAAREEADKVIAATRAQIEATVKQTATAVQLERDRIENEDLAFRAMLEAAMARVLAEAGLLRTTYPSAFARPSTGVSVAPDIISQCITRGAFGELRAACVRQGSPLTGEFLELERKIDSLASQAGIQTDLGDQLASIEAKATALRDKAAERT
jgi:hypothetical protein